MYCRDGYLAKAQLTEHIYLFISPQKTRTGHPATRDVRM